MFQRRIQEDLPVQKGGSIPNLSGISKVIQPILKALNRPENKGIKGGFSRDEIGGVLPQNSAAQSNANACDVNAGNGSC